VLSRYILAGHIPTYIIVHYCNIYTTVYFIAYRSSSHTSR